RLPGSEQCGMGLNCCEANGPRGLFAIPMHLVMERKEGLQVNYFSEGTFQLKSPRGSLVTLTQHTDYPKSGAIEMTVDLQKPEAMEIDIRIPGWSKSTKLSVNGVAVDNMQPGQYAQIKRAWKTGDKISLELDMRGHIVETGTSTRSIAILRGPIVLSRDSRFEGASIAAVLKPVADKGGYITLTPVPNQTSDDILMLYKVDFIPESYTESPKGPVSITLCDYASAGNGHENSFYKVWSPQLLNPSTY
ncbi:MAG TPA: hypothetical protein VGM63_12240, partial [Mucilaginibacter sp.]